MSNHHKTPNRKKLNRQRKKQNYGRNINKNILGLAIFLSVLFACLMLYLAYFLTFKASAVINNTYNKRSETFKASTVRGSITDRDGNILAYTETAEDGTETRIYPYGNLFAHVVGIEDHGGLGLESSYNYYLLTSHSGLFSKISNEISGTKNQGDSIQTTLSCGLQQDIYDLMSAYEGAAIAIDPSTGEILSMVSKPDFDPNTIDSIWDEITADENNSVLLNRATQGLYTPGSTFKIFTLYEYLKENGSGASSYSYDCTGSTTIDGNTLSCYGGAAHGYEDLTGSFANSCNCSFANIGIMLDMEKFQETCDDLLFNQDLNIDIASNASSFELSSSSSTFEIMQTSIGQGETLCSPLHLAMVMSAIANDGLLMKPHLVTTVTNADGRTVTTFKDTTYSRLFTSSETETLKSYLRAVVTSGTGYALITDSYTAYGKTGTAETVSRDNTETQSKDHSWFVGYAENNGQKLVVCVIIEDMNAGYAKAVDLARQIFDYYYVY